MIPLSQKWARSGVYVAGAYSLLLLIFILIGAFVEYFSIQAYLFGYLYSFISFPALLLTGGALSDSILLYSINILFAFAIGAILGWSAERTVPTRQALNQAGKYVVLMIAALSLVQFIALGPYPARCTLLFGGAQDRCYQEVAVTWGLVSYCHEEETCIRNVASSWKKFSLCEDIGDIRKRSLCMVSSVHQPDCSTLTQQEEKDRCKFFARMHEPDCSIVRENERDPCYHSSAILKSDPQLCVEIVNVEDEKKCTETVRSMRTAALKACGSDVMCIVNQASEPSESVFCSVIEEKNDRRTCYRNTIFKKTVCENLEESERRDECFFLLAQGKCDYTYCSSIADAHIQQQCVASFHIEGDTYSCPPMPAPSAYFPYEP